MIHAIGRRAAAVIAATLLCLGVATTATATATAATGPVAAGWFEYGRYASLGACQDMRYFLNDAGAYPLDLSKCTIRFQGAYPYQLLVFG